MRIVDGLFKIRKVGVNMRREKNSAIFLAALSFSLFEYYRGGCVVYFKFLRCMTMIKICRVL